MKPVRWFVSYILVAILGLWLAFLVSIRFLTPAYSQNQFSEQNTKTESENEINKKNSQDSIKSVIVPEPPVDKIIEKPNESAKTGNLGLDEIIQNDDIKYDPMGKRDPFEPYKAGISLGRHNSTDKHGLESSDPLQNWDVDRLRVVGILWDVRSPRAMVRDPNGRLYILFKNSRVGRNEGFVAAIREGEVVVIETIYDEGQPVKETRLMELKK